MSVPAAADTGTGTEAKILAGNEKPGSMQRSSSESAVEIIGPMIDRDIAVLNEQRAQTALMGVGDAMRLLTRLVSAPIINNNDASASANNSTDTTPRREDENDEKRVLEEIDRLLESFSFLSASTPFPALLNACVMLRDTHRLTAQEADEAVCDSQKAQAEKANTEIQLAEANGRIAELSRKNDKLKKERKVLARCVKSFMSNVEHEKEQQLQDAYAFITHEMVLQSPKSKTSIQSPKHTRYETPIDQNVFLEAMRADDAATPSFPTQELPTNASAGANAAIIHPNSPPPNMPRLPSHQSTEWRATVVISPGAGQEPHHRRAYSCTTVASCVSGTDDATYITAPEEEAEDEGELMPAGDFLAARMNDELIDRNLYAIAFPTNKIGLEIITISKGGELQSQQPAKKKSGIYSYQRCPDSFVITGYKSYYSHARRPELGARLVSIDGERVDYGTWSLKKIGERIRAKKGGVKLGFRNDPLPKAVVDFLNVKGKKMSSRRAGENEAPVAAIRVPNNKDIAAHKIKLPLLNIDNHQPPQSLEPARTPARRQESGVEVVWRKRNGGSGISIPMVSPAKKD